MNRSTKPMPIIVLCLGMAIPTLITWIYFDLLASAPAIAQKFAYAAGKLSQVGIMLMAYWLWRIRSKNSMDEQSLLGKPVCMRWLSLGAVSGIAIGMAAIAIFQWVLLPLGVMESVKLEAKVKLQSLGADSPAVLLAIALFYSLIHSGFEEFYWRGFVFRGLKEHMSAVPSVCLSSLGFMSHHVLVLGKFFGYDSIMTYLLALSVAIGGMIWAVMYHRCGNLIPGWISHAIVDAAIFVIGYLLVFA
jgi:uncharacterized protein